MLLISSFLICFHTMSNNYIRSLLTNRSQDAASFCSLASTSAQVNDSHYCKTPCISGCRAECSQQIVKESSVRVGAIWWQIPHRPPTHASASITTNRHKPLTHHATVHPQTASTFLTSAPPSHRTGSSFGW